MAYQSPGMNYPYPAYGNYNPITPFTPTQPVQMTQPTQPAQQNTFVCRPVASREEALAVPVDFMGAPMFFPDLAHGVIYMKRLNTQTGSADLFEFRTEQRQERQEPAFASIQDVMDLKENVEQLRSDVEKLKKPTKAVRRNDSDE